MTPSCCQLGQPCFVKERNRTNRQLSGGVRPRGDSTWITSSSSPATEPIHIARELSDPRASVAAFRKHRGPHCFFLRHSRLCHDDFTVVVAPGERPTRAGLGCAPKLDRSRWPLLRPPNNEACRSASSRTPLSTNAGWPRISAPRTPSVHSRRRPSSATGRVTCDALAVGCIYGAGD